jgi:integrase
VCIRSRDKLGRLADGSRAEEEFAPSAVICIRLLLLTVCRLGEIQTVKWSYLDLDTCLAFHPDFKTGRKSLYLGSVAMKLLRSIPRRRDNPCVITGDVEGQQLTDMQKSWRSIRKLAELPDVRIHDLRHTFASNGVELGQGLPIIGKLLGHTQPQTTVRYAHLVAAPVLEVADKISENPATFIEWKNAG